MKKVLLYIWCLPQNLLGLLFLLFLRGEKRHKQGDITFYYCKGFRGGISLGNYIIIGSKAEKTVKHEYGHCLQSRMLGPLYLLVVGLPSLIWAGLYGWVVPYTTNGYYKFYTERWADKLGKVKR